MFDPVIQRLREMGSPGLIMSGSKDEGALLGGVRPSALPCGRGVLVTRRGGARLVQVALAGEVTGADGVAGADGMGEAVRAGGVAEAGRSAGVAGADGMGEVVGAGGAADAEATGQFPIIAV